MDFALSEEQILLQDQMHRALSGHLAAGAVAGSVAEGGPGARDLWSELTGLGLPGLLIAEEHGGLGLGLLDAALMAEVLARHAVTAPFLSSVVAAPLALSLAGSPAQQAAYLPRLARGELRIAAALSEPLAGARNGAGVTLAGESLSGSAQMVIDAKGADLVLVATLDGRLALVAPGAAGVKVHPLDIVDRTRSAAWIEFDGARAEAVLPGDALARLGAALRVVTAGDLLGAADRMLAAAVDYAGVRRQFGRPIGSFQAVKHMCAEMAAELEPGRALVWYAAHALDEGLDDAQLASLHAKAVLGEAARLVSQTATQVHGGVGITEELGLHVWFKRISLSSQLFGGPARLREEAARLQLDALAGADTLAAAQ